MKIRRPSPWTVRCCLVVSLLLLAGGAVAAPDGLAEKSLDRCQTAARAQGIRYLTACTGPSRRVSARRVEVLKKNASSLAGARAVCTAQFDKLGRSDGQSFADQFTESVTKECALAPTNAHSLDDLLGGALPDVAQPLNVSDLGSRCARYGGDGSIDSVDEWVGCIRAGLDCSLYNIVAAEFPRGVEWLNRVAAEMPVSDGRTALLAFEAALDGASDDDRPDLTCGSTCGDAVKIATEQCDGDDLGGATCESLGYALGRLACDRTTCAFDRGGCSTGSGGLGFPATGQMRCWEGDDFPAEEVPCTGTGQDGEIQAGAPLAYVDNGDGTITDLNTGLMWEKKSDDGTIHDKDDIYTWHGECTAAPTCGTPCETDADCATGTCGSVDPRAARTPRQQSPRSSSSPS